MITGDLDRALAIPGGSAGTWRPAPAAGARLAGAGAAPEPGAHVPGSYATWVAFRLARRDGGDPGRIAAGLARRLAGMDWVAAATVTGGGYVTVTVTADALGALAGRISRAGAGCARSDALRGLTLTAPRSPGLAVAGSWPQAHGRLARHLAGRLAAAAGATVTWLDDPERLAPRAAIPHAGHGPVAEAIEYAGAGAITWALGRLPPGATAAGGAAGGAAAASAAGGGVSGARVAGRTAVLDPSAAAAHDLRNPAYAVRYAHAHAASALRQAGDLGLVRGAEAAFEPRLLAHHSELALLDALSWLPERVAGAARRGRPDAFARYLEGLAGAYLDCQESCPAVWPGMPPGGPPSGDLPPGGDLPPSGERPPGGDPLAGEGLRAGRERPAGGQPADPGTAARLWLASAAGTALAAGLALFGVDAPDRL